MGCKTYAALKINGFPILLLWFFKPYPLNILRPIDVYRYTVLLVSTLLSISSAVIASFLFISIIAFLGSNLYHHSILSRTTPPVIISKYKYEVSAIYYYNLVLFVRWIRVKVGRGVPSSPSTLQLSNHCALLPSRTDPQFCIGVHSVNNLQLQ